MTSLDQILQSSKENTDAVEAAIAQTQTLANAIIDLLENDEIDDAIALAVEIRDRAAEIVAVTLENTEHAAILEHPAFK